MSIDGQITIPGNLKYKAGMTLPSIIEASKGLTVFAHKIVIFREDDDVQYLFIFDVKLLQSKLLTEFKLQDGDSIQIDGKKLYRGRYPIPSAFKHQIKSSAKACYSVDYTRMKNKK